MLILPVSVTKPMARCQLLTTARSYKSVLLAGPRQTWSDAAYVASVIWSKTRSYFSLFQSVPILKPTVSSRYWFCCSEEHLGWDSVRTNQNQLQRTVVSSLGDVRKWMLWQSSSNGSPTQMYCNSLHQIIPWGFDAISEKPRAKTFS